jgi:putative restriction endonuclease
MPPTLLSDYLTTLPARHREALAWFESHAGEEVPWPRPLPDGTFLATRAKGIYKPSWSSYALSVRQSLEGPYPDRAVEWKADGAWSYAYYQERLEVDERDLAFTNKGLMKCYEHAIPIGVLIQTRPKPLVRYRVLGLALIGGYGGGYFQLYGLRSSTDIAMDRSRTTVAAATTPQLRADLFTAVFDPRAIKDERERVLTTILQRQGQPGFRRTLMKAYGSRCAVSSYDAPQALEAAHIVPYRGPVTNHPSNGLLLRADLHSLFDLGLVAVDPDEWRLLLSPDIRMSSYEKFHGAEIRRPSDPSLHPSAEALKEHRRFAAF